MKGKKALAGIMTCCMLAGLVPGGKAEAGTVPIRNIAGAVNNTGQNMQGRNLSLPEALGIAGEQAFFQNNRPALDVAQGISTLMNTTQPPQQQASGKESKAAGSDSDIGVKPPIIITEPKPNPAPTPLPPKAGFPSKPPGSVKSYEGVIKTPITITEEDYWEYIRTQVRDDCSKPHYLPEYQQALEDYGRKKMNEDMKSGLMGGLLVGTTSVAPELTLLLAIGSVIGKVDEKYEKYSLSQPQPSAKSKPTGSVSSGHGVTMPYIITDEEYNNWVYSQLSPCSQPLCPEYQQALRDYGEKKMIDDIRGYGIGGSVLVLSVTGRRCEYMPLGILAE